MTFLVLGFLVILFVSSVTHFRDHGGTGILPVHRKMTGKMPAPLNSQEKSLQARPYL